MNTALPKVTFFLPVYNEEKRISRCIESILKQDYPREKIEILVIDGGSGDKTKELASSFECTRIFDNAKKLADFGIKICMRHATGDIFVIFAADNELVSSDWLRFVSDLFINNYKLSVLWCKMIASENDAPINKYYELIQNDPLSFFANKNLQNYLKNTKAVNLKGRDCYIFDVCKNRPLVWGANGLVYRTGIIRDIVLQDKFIADNDLFQTIVENGYNQVAYIPNLYVFHHSLKNIPDWVRKWNRNYVEHFLNQRKTRNLNWIMDKEFNWKLLLWIVYSCLPVFSIIHSIYLSVKDKRIHWLYHPLMNFLQLATYSYLTLSKSEGRQLIKESVFYKNRNKI